jgi:hypothetical protein
LFGYKAIIFYTSRDTTKLAFLTLAVLKLAVLVSGVLALAKLGLWISLLAVLTLADLEGSRKFARI